jgi:ATP-binding cassette subfamily B protein
MDPWAEAEWFDNFREICQNRTAILITHRFTIAMNADCIHVLKDGKIVEAGRHADLLAWGGYYAQTWNSQMASILAVSPELTGDEALK